jgi:hypothetical protein
LSRVTTGALASCAFDIRTIDKHRTDKCGLAFA